MKRSDRLLKTQKKEAAKRMATCEQLGIALSEFGSDEAVVSGNKTA